MHLTYFVLFSRPCSSNHILIIFVMNVIKIFKPLTLNKTCLVYGFTTACQRYQFRLNMIVQVIIRNQEGLTYIGNKFVYVYLYVLIY